MSQIISGCIYCGSTNYGRSCIFGPQNVHVITSKPNQCVYCGSASYGSGCAFNPYGNVHVRAATFLNRNLTEKLILLKYFLEKKVEEKSNLDKFYIKLSEKINYCIDPLIHTFLIQEEVKPDKVITDSNLNLKLKQELLKTFEKFDYILETYKNEMPLSTIENTILECILSPHL